MELAGHAPPHAVDAALKACRDEDRRLAATERAVELMEGACAVKSLNPGLEHLTGCLEGFDFRRTELCSCSSVRRMHDRD